jgi:hypothetical protein
MNWACGVALLAALFLPLSAKAQPAPSLRSQAAIKAARAALERRDLAAAQRELETAYRAEAAPELLELLGQVAEQAGERVAAADLYRRFLEDYAGPASRRDALLAVIEAALQRAAEVSVSGEPGAFVRVDGRLVGRLPLSRALLLPPGRHQISQESGGRPAAYLFEARAGVPAAVRFVADSSHVAIETQPPVLLLMYDGQAQPAASLQTVARALRAGVRQDGQAHDLAAERLLSALAQAPAGCLATPKCIAEQAKKLGAQGALLLGTAPALKLAFIDARLGVQSDEVDVACPGCAVESQAQAVQKAAQELVAQLIGRAYGRIEVHATPPDAEVEQKGGAKPHKLPAELPVSAGSTELLLRRPGYLPQRVSLDLKADELRIVDLALRPNAAAQRRKKVAVGKWLLISAGALGVVGGVLGLALNERFTRPLDPPGPNGETSEVFTSQLQGGVFLGLGLAVLGGGIGLAVYEKRLEKQATDAENEALSRPATRM